MTKHRVGIEQLRRAGAPRLIEWTGERMVPWTPDVQVIYEHLHRYWLVAGLADGRRVLDLGSGEGYGSAILATSADSVVGLDTDEQTVAHAEANYSAEHLRFEVGSAIDLSRFEDNSFDLVVCFEVIEHLVEQETLISEANRVLSPAGIFVCSTPDRRMYRAGNDEPNPFHQKELTAEELDDLLHARFPNVKTWGQQTIAGSMLSDTTGAPGDAAAEVIYIGGREGGWLPSAPPSPVYLVAVAGHEALPQLPDRSILADPALALVRELARDLHAASAREQHAASVIAQGERRIDEFELRLAAVAKAAAVRDQRDLEIVRSSSARAEEIAVLRKMISQAEAAEAAAEGTAAYLWGEIDIAHARLRRIDASVSWRLLERARGKLSSANTGGRGRGARVTSAVLNGLGRGLREAARPTVDQLEVPEPPLEPTLHFPIHGSPRVSVVVPVFGQAELTLACLEAIHATTEGVSYEVIVVDDGSGPELSRALQKATGINVLRNERNLHFLRSANRGASAARGDYVVFLNNDTEPQAGWLDALVATADADESVGVVGAKLLLPDHRVQEAGAIVWRDGSAHHVGRGEHPEEPRLNYVRDVDYVSGACLLVRAEVLRGLGGFDERFIPAYYEDVDLCFAVRAAGLRVVYQPQAVVIHHEGATHGTDLTVGVKAHQVSNQAIFAAKWKTELEGHPVLDPRNEYRHQDRRAGYRVLVVDHQVPAMHEDAGSMRMHYMLRALVASGCRITFLPDNRHPRSPQTDELQQLGIEVLYGSFQERLLLAALGDELTLAILSRPTVAWRYLYLIREFNRRARIVYDTVDLHYLREERRAVASDDTTVQRVSEIFLEMERGLVRTCDETIAVSAVEADAIRDLVPGAHVSELPTLHPVRQWVPPHVLRKGLLFVGGFDHQPNVDAAIALVERVVPLVRAELGAIPVWIVGSRPPARVRELGESEGVEVTGFVEEIEPYFDRARLLVAPLSYGAGVKGKITQSMALGLPVVTTPVGAEGLEADSGSDLLVAETPEQLAAEVVRAYRDDALWTSLSGAGLALAERRFSPTVAQSVLDDLLERAVIEVST